MLDCRHVTWRRQQIRRWHLSDLISRIDVAMSCWVYHKDLGKEAAYCNFFIILVFAPQFFHGEACKIFNLPSRICIMFCILRDGNYLLEALPVVPIPLKQPRVRLYRDLPQFSPHP